MAPKRDKLYDVTYKKVTRRVAGNTAQDATSQAFPQAHFTEVHVTCVGKAIDAAIEAQDAQTVRPPALEGGRSGPCVRCGRPGISSALVCTQCVVDERKGTPDLRQRNRNLRDFAYKLQTERRTLRAQALAGRVAARLLDECYQDSLTVQWEIPAKAFTELLLCARELYGRGL